MGDVANFPLSFIENHDFITDCARYAEGLYSEAAVKKKYHFDDATWEQLGSLGGWARGIARITGAGVGNIGVPYIQNTRT